MRETPRTDQVRGVFHVRVTRMGAGEDPLVIVRRTLVPRFGEL
ncbi:hypothetical protein [Rhodococcus erythropolis]|nr:hypothetical protein [Rhodococcus erythropolis]